MISPEDGYTPDSAVMFTWWVTSTSGLPVPACSAISVRAARVCCASSPLAGKEGVEPGEGRDLAQRQLARRIQAAAPLAREHGRRVDAVGAKTLTDRARLRPAGGRQVALRRAVVHPEAGRVAGARRQRVADQRHVAAVAQGRPQRGLVGLGLGGGGQGKEQAQANEQAVHEQGSGEGLTRHGPLRPGKGAGPGFGADRSSLTAGIPALDAGIAAPASGRYLDKANPMRCEGRLMSQPQPRPFGPDHYLAWEQEQPAATNTLMAKSLRLAGVGCHGTAAGNLAALLHGQLRGKPCRPFIADMKVHVETANSFFYPDILVTCDPRDRTPEASHVKRHPVLIVEVLSPTTEAYDRGNKFAAYRTLASLQEYVLVSTEQRRVEVFRRDDTGHWVLYPFAADEEMELAERRFPLPGGRPVRGRRGAITGRPRRSPKTQALVRAVSSTARWMCACSRTGRRCRSSRP